MQITLHRHPGFFARMAQLDILLNGERIAHIKANETISVPVPDEGAEIQVSMQGHVSSSIFYVPAHAGSLYLECGNPLWVLFDIFSFAYLPALKGKVFFLREAKGRAQNSTAHA